MIRINRETCPDILLSIPRRKSYYQDDRVTSILNSMQFSKCSYCEKDIRNDFQVDHYIPQDHYKTLMVNGKKQCNWNEANRWENLLLSCGKCNRSKSNKNPFSGPIRVIIDPTVSNPERFIDFNISNISSSDLRVQIIPKNNSKIGKSTINKLSLDIRLRDHISNLELLAIDFENWFLKLVVKIRNGIAVNNAECQGLIIKINTSMLSNIAYAGFARSFFRRRLDFFDANERGNLERITGGVINLNIQVP